MMYPPPEVLHLHPCLNCGYAQDGHMCPTGCCLFNPMTTWNMSHAEDLGIEALERLIASLLELARQENDQDTYTRIYHYTHHVEGLRDAHRWNLRFSDA